jgi:GAF domain-containing protein
MTVHRGGTSDLRIDKEALTGTLRRLTERGQPDGNLRAALHEVTEACVELFGVSGSGIMLADEQNISRYVAASDGPGRILETLESELGQGPCTEAFVLGHPITVTDVVVDPRWPDLATAMAPHDVHAILGVPVRLGGVIVGTLDVYRDHPADWDESESAALSRFSAIIGTILSAALSAQQAHELAGQLQYALDYRVVIERGVGYLMARDDIDAVVAFNRLRRAARSTQSKIGDVALQLLETGRLPTDSTHRRPIRN